MRDTLDVARANMAREMRTFPWQKPGPLDSALEADAAAAGLTIGKRRDEAFVRGHVAVAKSLVADGVSKPTTVVLIQGPESKPRSREFVLAQQAIVNAGIPAFIMNYSAKGRHMAAIVLVPSAS